MNLEKARLSDEDIEKAYNEIDDIDTYQLRNVAQTQFQACKLEAERQLQAEIMQIRAELIPLIKEVNSAVERLQEIIKALKAKGG